MKKIGRTLAVCVTASILAASAAVSASAASFRDVSGHWAESTINQWVDSGYISGYPDGTFRPRNPITRTEFAVVANNAFHFWNTTAIHFPDVSETFWGYGEIQKAYAAGYMKGDANGTFRPKGNVTRQEAAVMLANIKGLGSGGGAVYYSDNSSISGWARGSVNAVTAAGYMSGYPDGTFRPKAQISRAEVVTMLNKALGTTTNTPYVPPVTQQPSNNTPTSVQNMTLQESSLRNTVVSGNLTIPSSMSNRSITLDNVTVRGTLIVEGGGTITVDGCSISELRMNKSSATFRSEGGSTVSKTTFRSNGTLEGSGYNEVSVANSSVNTVTIDGEVNALTLDTDADVRLYGDADIETFEATKNADDALIEISRGARVGNMILRDQVRIAGRGNIDNMTVYVSGVNSEIEPDSLSRRNGAASPDFDYEYDGTRHESNSSSSSSSSSSNRVISRDFDGNGGRYRNVTVTRGVDVEDMRITGNLTIDEDVGNGTVRLEDLEIDGSVYVYGGGGKSVIFENCDIDGDIISDKDSSGRNQEIVALRFDGDTTVRGEVRILDDTILDRYSGSPKLDDVTVETRDAELTVGIDIGRLILERRAEIDVESGADIDTVRINSGISGESTIRMSGTSSIKTLDARSDVSVTGSGSVGTVTESSGANADIGSGITNTPGETTGTLKVTLPATASVEVGKTVTLTAKVEPDSTADKTVTWKTDNTAVATVAANGTVTGVAKGTATITATLNADGTKSATCLVTVADAGTLPEDPDTPVTGPTLKPAVVSMQKGGNQTLTLVLPDGYVDKVTYTQINWKVETVSSDTAGATVAQLSENKTGTDLERTLTALNPGTAKVTVTIRNGADTLAETTSDVAVTANGGGDPLTGVAIKYKSKVTTGINIKQGTDFNQLEAVLEPDTAGYSVLTWTSSDTAVVEPNIQSSDSNKRTYLNAKALGKATITLRVRPVGATSEEDDFVASCDVTVSETGEPVAVTGVTVNPSALSLQVGSATNGTGKVTATIAPKDATNKAVTWSTSDDKIATVSDDGTVTAVSAGQAVIKATTVDGEKTATCTVTVAPQIPVESVELSASEENLNVGGTLQLNATVNPNNATNKAVTWSSNHEDIATVSDTGLVTAKATGTAVITVTTKDGGKTDTCAVTVSAPSDNVTITLPETKEIEMLPTGKATLTPTTVTEGAQVTWSSGTPDVARVDANSGEITALKPGVTTITATASKDGKTGTDTCEVTIKPGLVITYEGVDENDKTPQAKPGEKITFKAQVKPKDAVPRYGIAEKVTSRSTGESTNWTDENGLLEWGEIDADGNADLILSIPGTATEGDYTLTVAVAPNGATDTALDTEKPIDFRVLAKPTATVTITPLKNTDVAQGGKLEYTYTVKPENAAVEFKFTLTHGGAVLEGTDWDNSPVDDTEPGKIIVNVPVGAPAGAYTLKVENDPLSAINATIQGQSEFSFTVTESEDITLNPSTLTFYLQKLDGEIKTPSQTITATLPSDIADQTVTWDLTNCNWLEKESQNDTDTHTAKFKLKESEFTGWGTATGNYYIAATAGGKTKTCNVEVKCEQATGIELDKKTLTVTVGAEAEILTATVQPGDKARDLSVAWETSDRDETDKYISIDYSEKSNICKVTALKPTATGNTVTINARTADWTQGYATCEVTVKAADPEPGAGDTPTESSTESQPSAATQAVSQNTAPTVQQNTAPTVQQTSAPRAFSFIPQRALQTSPVVQETVTENIQTTEKATERPQEPEKAQEPEKEPEKTQEPEKEPEKVQEPEQPAQPEQKPETQGIALTCADSFKAGETLTLSGTVNGVSGAVRKIEWSIRDAGATGATIRDGALNAEQAGTVTIAATVQNSGTTQYFTITVLPGDGPKADEPVTQEPEQTEPQNPAVDGEPTLPAEGESTTANEGQTGEATAPTVQVGPVTLPNGQVIPNAKRLQRNIGAAIVLSALDALPANAVADSVVWKVESFGTTGAALQAQDNTLVNVNAKGVILLSRTLQTTGENGNVVTTTTYYEITVVQPSAAENAPA